MKDNGKDEIQEKQHRRTTIATAIARTHLQAVRFLLLRHLQCISIYFDAAIHKQEQIKSKAENEVLCV